MAKQVHRLTDRSAKSLGMGYHHDGHGLYLQVTSRTARSWIYRFKVHGRTKDAGLGGFPALSLAMARKKAEESRQLRSEGTR
jgi:hypothetical protein